MKIEKEAHNESTTWESWIIRKSKEESLVETNYDKLCELVVDSYQLANRSRKMDHLDRVTFFCVWWESNKTFMKNYTSFAAIGYLVGNRDHASIIHHCNAFKDDRPGRKVSYRYDENVKCIKDFLES